MCCISRRGEFHPGSRLMSNKMRDLTIAISVRVLFILAFCLKLFTIVYYEPGAYGTVEVSVTIFFFLTIVLLMLQFRKNMKRNDGRIVFNGHIVPEFNSSNEQEERMSGEAYKIAFSAVIVVSFLVIYASIFVLLSNAAIQPLYILLGIGFIPITGLITYVLAYRHQYIK